MGDFKTRFKDLRLQHHLSQRAMAKELNVSNSLIALYETGQRMPSREQLEEISDYFNVDISYLLGKDDVITRILKPEEMRVIDAYRNASDGIKIAVRKLLDVPNDSMEDIELLKQLK